MKRYISILLALLLIFSCLLTISPQASAAKKETIKRAISIVFDNSGSMYEKKNKAWCRATYAMEVFASMLNEKDELQIYPMNPIEVNGQQYTMESPLVVKDPAEATEKIHNIFTPHNDWKEAKDGTRTHIETIDYAAKGLEKMPGDEKYLVILTDGTNFYEKNKDLADKSKQALEKRIDALVAKKNMKVMFLGIDKEATMPDVAKSEYFTKDKAENSASVLATLTKMCNLIFGRDSLPSSRISGKKINFDISMKKLIVFVQGKDITGLKVTNEAGAEVGKLVRTQQTAYATKGTGKETLDNEPDTSLQGMIVTYEDCTAGEYSIQFSGEETSIEVYYEPNADLDFVFTDAAGNTVDPNALYEGDYKVSFGMKDAKTGKLISSDLLGQPRYQGSYSINGKKTSFSKEGFSGSEKISLKMGDKFEADLTVTYLSGYTISKDSTDFGWPEGGIQVAPRPAGDFRLEISGGDDLCSLQDLEEGAPYIAKVYYQGTQLTGSELEKVELKWEPETSNAEIKKEFADDHWKLSLHYKDPASPQDTVCGECTVSIYAFYSAQGSSEAQAQCPLTYNIKDDFSPLQIDLYASETYIVIGELEESKEFVVNLKLNGAPLTAEDFANVNLQVDCGGIEHAVTANEQDSSYAIKLLPTKGVAEGNYQIKVTALYTDHIGRETAVNDAVTVTLSNIPLWVRWLIGIGLLILLLLLIWWITHLRVFPTTVRAENEGCSLRVGGKDVTENADFTARMSGKQVAVYVEYNAEELGRVAVNDLAPGKESYLYKPSPKRSFLVKFPDHVSVSGEVSTIDVAGIEYRVDREGTLRPAEDPQAPYAITNGASITINGKTMIAGKLKNFNAEIPMNFKKR